MVTSICSAANWVSSHIYDVLQAACFYTNTGSCSFPRSLLPRSKLSRTRGINLKMKGITKLDRGEEEKMWLTENNCIGGRTCMEQEGEGEDRR